MSEGDRVRESNLAMFHRIVASTSLKPTMIEPFRAEWLGVQGEWDRGVVVSFADYHGNTQVECRDFRDRTVRSDLALSGPGMEARAKDWLTKALFGVVGPWCVALDRLMRDPSIVAIRRQDWSNEHKLAVIVDFKVDISGVVEPVLSFVDFSWSQHPYGDVRQSLQRAGDKYGAANDWVCLTADDFSAMYGVSRWELP